MHLEKWRLTEEDPRTQVVEVWMPQEQKFLAKNAFEKLYRMRSRPDYGAEIPTKYLQYYRSHLTSYNEFLQNL